jgi:GNAT superfamily N-acetyltransferase
MAHHPLSALFYADVVPAFPEFCLVALDVADRPVAKAYSLPVAWPDDPAADLPPDGHDAVILQAIADRLAGRAGTVVAAVEITVRVEARGRGLSRMMLDAMRANAARLGFRSLVAPVRPTGTAGDPPMAAYARLTRPDGLPVDPWLRTHVRAGGRIRAVAPYSMTLAGTLAQWRAWTGLPFDRTGPVRVPGTLAPVHCEVAHDHAVYVEPNVWVHHRLAP